MRKVMVFNNISLDGFFTDAHNEMNFTQDPRPDPEWDAFVAGNAAGGSSFLFGRLTYQMMAAYWPTPAAVAAMPTVAKTMNDSPKIVFSRTLDKADWKNTTILNTDPADEVRRLKNGSGKDFVIFGSGTIVSQLAQNRLIDEYQFIVNPVVLGKGRTMFDGMATKLPLNLVDSRAFKNGNVWLRYLPV